MTMARLIILFLILLTCFTFYQVVTFDFVIYDDHIYVSKNPHISSGLKWPSIVWAFQANLTQSTPNADYWQPITFISRILDIQFYGLKAAGHHATNLLLHILNAILIYLILVLLTKNEWLGLIVSTLFAIHPMQIDCVSWVTARKDVLSAFFGLLTVWFYLKNSKKVGWQSGVSYALSVMSKPMLISMPFLLFLLDTVPSNQKKKSIASFIKKGFLDKLPIFLIAFISISITLFSKASSNAIHSPIFHLEQIPLTYLRYITKILFPHPLPAVYASINFSLVQIIGALLLILLFTAWSYRKRQQYPYVFLGWFWFMITLLPSVPLAFENRFVYIPSIGIFMIFAVFLSFFIVRYHISMKYFLFFYFILLAGMSSYTKIQSMHWKNSIDLFNHTLQITPNNSRAHHLLAIALSEQGDVDRAVPHFKEALQNKPADAIIFNNIASLFFDNGQVEDAIRYYKKAVELKKDYAVGYNNLGFTYLTISKPKEALFYLQKALKIDPDFSEAYYNLGRTSRALGNNDKAIHYFKEAVRLKPQLDDAHKELGLLFADLKRYPEALEEFNYLLKHQPNNPIIYNLIGNTFYVQQKFQESLFYFEKAIQLDPDFAVGRSNLGNTLFALGRFKDARNQYLQAIRLEPEYVEAHNNLGALELKSGNVKEAVRYFQKALELDPDSKSAQKNLELLNR